MIHNKKKKNMKNVLSVKLSCVFSVHIYRYFCLSHLLYAAFIAIEGRNKQNLSLFPTVCILRCLQDTLPTFVHTAKVEFSCKAMNTAGFSGSHLCIAQIADSVRAEGECVHARVHSCNSSFDLFAVVELNYIAPLQQIELTSYLFSPSVRTEW